MTALPWDLTQTLTLFWTPHNPSAALQSHTGFFLGTHPHNLCPKVFYALLGKPSQGECGCASGASPTQASQSEE